MNHRPLGPGPSALLLSYTPRAVPYGRIRSCGGQTTRRPVHEARTISTPPANRTLPDRFWRPVSSQTATQNSRAHIRVRGPRGFFRYREDLPYEGGLACRVRASGCVRRAVPPGGVEPPPTIFAESCPVPRNGGVLKKQSEWQESHLRPRGPRPRALTPELHPDGPDSGNRAGDLRVPR